MRAEVSGIYQNEHGDRFFYRAGAYLPDGLTLASDEAGSPENADADTSLAETRVEPTAPKSRRRLE